MELFIFVTYMISVASIALTAYALVEIRDLKREIRRQRIDKRLEQITQPKTKSLWK